MIDGCSFDVVMKFRFGGAAARLLWISWGRWRIPRRGPLPVSGYVGDQASVCPVQQTKATMSMFRISLCVAHYRFPLYFSFSDCDQWPK